MLQALFNGLSGLFGFSKSLDKIGNNISNMNTPGFRGERAFFENVGNGMGTQLSQDFMDLSQGDTQQTGTSTDVAIQGKGLFVLHDDNGNVFYTREGHFQFDDDGYLVDDTTGYRVVSLNNAGETPDFNISDLTTLAPQASTAANFTGNLSKSDTTRQVTGVQVYDASGGVHPLTVTFTNNTTVTAGSWTVDVKDDKGVSVGSGEIRFATDGSPQAGFNSISLNLSYNGSTQVVALNFGTPGALSGATQITGMSSNIVAKVMDGHGTIGASQVFFDSSGTLQITYADNERRQGPQLALALIEDEQKLLPGQAALYTASPNLEVALGGAGSGRLGKILGGSLELSNVDLTRELTEMIIVQRGYQASSRVLSITDTMLQQLYSSTGGGGG